MIKLKQIILESQELNHNPFKLPYDKDWEYKIVNGVYYTREIGDTEWLDMKQSLSDKNYKIAIDKIDTFLSKSSNKKQLVKTDLTQDEPKKQDKPKKQDPGITRDSRGYITSNKASVYGKSLAMKPNTSIVIAPYTHINYIDRKTGIQDMVPYMGFVKRLVPEEANQYTVGDIRTITMPNERGINGTPDPYNGRKFTYLYITHDQDGSKGWIPSSIVKLIG